MPIAEPTVAELSERLRVAEETLQQTEHLAVANRYAAAIMHEINNPLEALTNLVFLTKHNAGDPTKVIAYSEIAEAQLAQMGELTRRTLTFYRDTSAPIDFDLVEIAESALRIHSKRLKNQGVQIYKNTPEKARVKVFPGQILQVVSNLILNSLDALPETGGALFLRIKTYGGKIHLLIADNGAGVEPSMYEDLFRPQVTSKPQGNGLGLWLSREIVHKHTGTIRYRSSRRPGRRGTMFKISLPVEGTGETSSADDSPGLHVAENLHGMNAAPSRSS